MMKRILVFLLLFLGLVCSPKVWSQERFFDARVSGYGELEQVLGDKWNTIDSLVVHGPISAPDFKTIVRCAKDGNLRIVNLQYAQVENHKIPDEAFVDRDWYTSGHYLDIRRIILPDDITEFGAFAFTRMTLSQINLPSSLRKMGHFCFDGNRWLEGDPLVIPEGVTEIPTRCFARCNSIKRIILPSTLKTINMLAFYYVRVEEMNFPEGLDSIGLSAIYATHLREIVLPNTVKRVGDSSFSNNLKLKRIVLPEGLTEIPDSFLSLCDMLEEANIPTTVTKIGRSAFQWCSELKVNQLPPKLRWIGYDAFDSCLLDSIVFPSTVEYIEGGAFRDLHHLQKIYSLSPNPPHCTEHPLANPGKGPFHGFTPNDIPVYVPIGSGEKYRKAFGWNYFTNIIETDKFPLGVEPPFVEGLGKYMVYGRDGSLVIELPEEPSSPILYSIYTVEGKTIAQGYLTGSHVLQLPSGGVYVVRVGTSIHKVSL